MSKYYPSNYYSLSAPTIPMASDFRRFIRRERIGHSLGRASWLGRLMNFVKGKPGVTDWIRLSGVGFDDRVLDVGTGAGHHLIHLRNMGFRCLAGVDPYINEDIRHEDIIIKKLYVEEITGQFDLVMFHHSFEHMPDPEATMLAAARLTTPGKLILIRIPVAGTHAWRTYGPDWVQLDAPRHFFLHTVKSMEILASRSGLVIERVEYDSSGLQFWGSERYVRDLPLFPDPPDGGSPIFSQEELARFEAHAVALNTSGDGDQACFYLRKPAASG